MKAEKGNLIGSSCLLIFFPLLGTGGIDERFVRRSKNAIKGMYRQRNLDWFLPTKGKESNGFSNRIDVEESLD